MSRRPPPNPARGTRATTNFGKAYTKEEGTVADAPAQTRTEYFSVDDMPMGPATVRFGHDKKIWGQHAHLDTGLSMGANCEVTICCAQDEVTLVRAHEIAKKMSKEFAWRAVEDVKGELIEFLENRSRR